MQFEGDTIHVGERARQDVAAPGVLIMARRRETRRHGCQRGGW